MREYVRAFVEGFLNWRCWGFGIVFGALVAVIVRAA